MKLLGTQRLTSARRLGARREYYSEDACSNRLKTSTSYSNVINEPGHRQNLRRALIDAYGNDERESSSESRVSVDRVGNTEVAMLSWLDTEEEEFDWEVMNLSVSRSSTNQSMASHCYQAARTSADSRTPASRHFVNRGTRRKLATAFSSSGMHCHSSAGEPATVKARYADPTSSAKLFPYINQHGSQLPLGNSIPPSMTQMRGSLNSTVADTVTDREQNEPLDSLVSRGMISMKPAVFPSQQPVSLPVSRRSQAQATPLAPQCFHQPTVSGSIPRGPLRAMPPAPSNLLRVARPPLPISNIPSSSLHLPRGPMPPLPSGALPALSISQGPGNQLARGAFSDLISSLMSQGLISLANQAPLVQDSVGLEFDVNHLKVRHESAVKALYADLPRQCTTCGLRLRSQDEHSSHMDWHVSKNRTAKNRKHNSSRKWYVSTSMWLSGAEALVAEAVPGFFTTETTEEKKSDEEMAVPADEDQTVCALCREPFEDFYSDEVEEWMYKGAVYLNAPPDGSTTGLDRSQLGPVVHAKCRSESSGAPAENF
ncbi:polyadenylation and cleavage factor homolog 4-like [Punica granatum]|uniref:Polyadenylation and cleavage factor homolog 4-like n=1 Tax=Punica granatum TaxID=22663 RepID=A0A6P8C4W2_PUNGR|nr:polyadenylation and cleavage factor homolog 4-like [Punica granatum]XP_031377765.1 polyadenylation and cleavage factor homolog 4-like [Punica granatum]